MQTVFGGTFDVMLWPRRSYNQVVQLAFRSCVHGFRSNTLTEKEKKCVSSTAGKMLRFADRLGHRFSEAQVKMAADAGLPK